MKYVNFVHIIKSLHSEQVRTGYLYVFFLFQSEKYSYRVYLCVWGEGLRGACRQKSMVFDVAALVYQNLFIPVIDNAVLNVFQVLRRLHQTTRSVRIVVRGV